MTLFIVKYAHRDGFNGWYDIAAYKTRKEADIAMQREKNADPGYLYMINTCELY